MEGSAEFLLHALGDLGVAQPVCEPFDKFNFSGCEVVLGRNCSLLLDHGRDKFTAHRSREGHFTGNGLLESVSEMVDSRVFEKVSGGASPQRRDDVLAGTKRGASNDDGVPPARRNLAGCVDTRDEGHLDIHEDHVGGVPLVCSCCQAAVGDFPDQLDFGTSRKHGAISGTDVGIVVNH